MRLPWTRPPNPERTELIRALEQARDQNERVGTYLRELRDHLGFDEPPSRDGTDHD